MKTICAITLLLAACAFSDNRPTITVTVPNLLEQNSLTHTNTNNGVEYNAGEQDVTNHYVHHNGNAYGAAVAGSTTASGRWANDAQRVHKQKENEYKTKNFVYSCAYTDAKYEYGNCAQPIASATDIHDAQVAVDVTYWRYDLSVNNFDSNMQATTANHAVVGQQGQDWNGNTVTGTPCNGNCIQTDSDAVYLIQLLKFDATDASNNKAEQVTIGYNIIDNVAPVVSICKKTFANVAEDFQEKIEAVHPTWKTAVAQWPGQGSTDSNNAQRFDFDGCLDSTTTKVNDVVDGECIEQQYNVMLSQQAKDDNSDRKCFWKHSLLKPATAEIASTISAESTGEDVFQQNNDILGVWTYQVYAIDSSQNVVYNSKTFIVQDTMKPVIAVHHDNSDSGIDGCKKEGTTYVCECSKSNDAKFHDTGFTCTDMRDGETQWKWETDAHKEVEPATWAGKERLDVSGSSITQTEIATESTNTAGQRTNQDAHTDAGEKLGVDRTTQNVPILNAGFTRKHVAKYTYTYTCVDQEVTSYTPDQALPATVEYKYVSVVDRTAPVLTLDYSHIQVWAGNHAEFDDNQKHHGDICTPDEAKAWATAHGDDDACVPANPNANAPRCHSTCNNEEKAAWTTAYPTEDASNCKTDHHWDWSQNCLARTTQNGAGHVDADCAKEFRGYTKSNYGVDHQCYKIDYTTATKDELKECHIGHNELKCSAHRLEYFRTQQGDADKTQAECDAYLLANFAEGHGIVADGTTGFTAADCKPAFMDANAERWLWHTAECVDTCTQRPKVYPLLSGALTHSTDANSLTSTSGLDDGSSRDQFNIVNGEQQAITSKASLGFFNAAGVAGYQHNVKACFQYKMQCLDQAGNVNEGSKFIEVCNVDKMKPLINLKGTSTNPRTMPAERSGTYQDDGATCYDQVDGQINDRIVVSGQVVNKAVVGTYIIKYECDDQAGNSAIPYERTVIIKDSMSPEVTRTGPRFIIAEASFKYTDPGCAATDNIDTTVSCVIFNVKERSYSRTETDASVTAWTSATTLYSHKIEGGRYTAEGADLPQATSYHADRPFTQSTPIDTTAHDVEFRIEYFATDSQNNLSFKSSSECLLRESCEDPTDATEEQTCLRHCRTVLVRDTLPPVIKISRGGNDIYDGAAKYTNSYSAKGTDGYATDSNAFPYSHGTANYESHDSQNSPLGRQSAGEINTDASADFVKERNGGYAHIASGSGNNGYLVDSLAEDSSVQSGINGWVVGAIASAISGLALLGYAGYSMKKRNGYSSTVMSVPV